MTIYILMGILAVALALVGGRRGILTGFTLLLNICSFWLVLQLILHGVQPVGASMLGCLLITFFTLFINNGINPKTIASFVSVVIVLMILWLLVMYMGRRINTAAFSFMEVPEIAGYSFNININMSEVAIACILMCLIGAIIDSSVAITSALFEVHVNNPQLGIWPLFKSGIHIGKDIMGTTLNTLFFAFLGTYMTMIIWFMLYGYSLSRVINNPAFCQEMIRILCSASGCVIIIPVSAVILALLVRSRLVKVMVALDTLLLKLRFALFEDEDEHDSNEAPTDDSDGIEDENGRLASVPAQEVSADSVITSGENSTTGEDDCQA